MNMNHCDDQTIPATLPADYLTWKSRCVEHFDHDAPDYDQEFLVKLLKGRELAAFRSLAPVAVPDTRALDFGSGTGRQVFELAGSGWTVDAYEAAPGMRRVMLGKLAEQDGDIACRVRLLQSEEEIAESSYLLVSSIGVMDYYPQPRMLLAQCRRAVAPGGYVMVSFPDRLSPMAWLYSAGSSTVARLRAFLHTRAAVRRAGEQLGLRFIGARRSPFDFALGGMLSFMLFRRPVRNPSNLEQTNPLEAIAVSPGAEKRHRVSAK